MKFGVFALSWTGNWSDCLFLDVGFIWKVSNYWRIVLGMGVFDSLCKSDGVIEGITAGV